MAMWVCGLLGACAGFVLALLGVIVYWAVGVFAAGHGWTVTDDQLTALIILTSSGLGVAGSALGMFLDF